MDRFLDRLDREQAETARREKEDNRGFFSKYVCSTLLALLVQRVYEYNTALLLILYSVRVYALRACAQWMYIVPFVLVMLFLSQSGGAEGGGGGNWTSCVTLSVVHYLAFHCVKFYCQLCMYL